MKTKSPAKAFGALLSEKMQSDPDFYLFSPDETTSNKIDAVYSQTTRAWGDLAIEKWDMPESATGRIIELLSENVLFSTMVGHLMTGKDALMTSYEAFFSIILSQIVQHLKFLEQAETVSWQKDYPSANLLSTSTCWRQDHNGFSHQSPILLSALLARPGRHVSCLFPLDAESVKPCFNYLFERPNQVNLVTLNKTDQPVFLNEKQAELCFRQGICFFDTTKLGTSLQVLDTSGIPEYDYIFVAAGDISFNESYQAVKQLQQDLPKLKIGLAYISALTYAGIGFADHPLLSSDFNQMFGSSAKIIANFHGYPHDLKNILANYINPKRIFAHGYEEQGSTVTPFAMLAMNRTSRFHLMLDVAKAEKSTDLISKYQSEIDSRMAYALEHGEDQA